MAVGEPPRKTFPPSWDYGSWDSYDRRMDYHRSIKDQPSAAEQEILFRLNRLEEMVAHVVRYADDSESEKKFLRIRNAELERLLDEFRTSYVPGSVPESSQVPLA